MSGGGDGNFFESLSGEGNFFENLAKDALNIGLQTATAGTVGYKDGKVGAGETTKGVVKGLKEVTGARAAEDANAMAREQFEQQAADAKKQRQDSQIQAGRDQIQQSNLAAGARRSAKAKAGNTNLLGSDEKDFLGL